jgi:hypothetical protein
MSVRQENRYRKLVITQGQALTDVKRELEAAFMVRVPRPVVTPPTPCATRRQVRRWMRLNACDYADATHLAEAANIVLDLPAGAMDDETHWVWDEALSALDWADA